MHVRLTSVCASCDFLLPLYLQIVYLLHPILVCLYSILSLLFLDICFYSKEREKKKGCWFEWAGSMGGSERSWGEEIIGRKYCMKTSIYDYKLNLQLKIKVRESNKIKTKRTTKPNQASNKTDPGTVYSFKAICKVAIKTEPYTIHQEGSLKIVKCEVGIMLFNSRLIPTGVKCHPGISE